MRSTNYGAATLLFFSPAISVELLTGNMPSSVFFTPAPFILMTFLYGGVALLLRETVARWRKGLASTLVLACGYGIVNEAIGSKGYFDPHFYSVIEFGLEGFGRYFGINVPWALNIGVVHLVCSMMIPITLVSVLFPGPGRWIGKGAYTILLAAVALALVFIFFVFAHEHWDPQPGALVLALLFLDILLARILPQLGTEEGRCRIGSGRAYLLGAFSAFAFIFLPSLVHKIVPSPLVYILFLTTFFYALPISLSLKLPPWGDRQKVALAAGLLSPMLLHAVTSHLLVPLVFEVLLLAAAWTRSGTALSPITTASATL